MSADDLPERSILAAPAVQRFALVAVAACIVSVAGVVVWQDQTPASVEITGSVGVRPPAETVASPQLRPPGPRRIIRSVLSDRPIILPLP